MYPRLCVCCIVLILWKDMLDLVCYVEQHTFFYLICADSGEIGGDTPSGACLVFDCV